MSDQELPCARSLLVFSDDWGRHPSSCQHLVRHLLRQHSDLSVTWVNTVGMRAPGLNWYTAKRGLEKVRQWLSRPAATTGGEGAPADGPAPPGLRVVSPRMWPRFRWGVERRLNRGLLGRAIAGLSRDLPRPIVAVTTIPIVADLLAHTPVDRWVYYCVDDFSVWPGLDQRPMAEMEALLVERCDELVSVSDALREKLAAAGRSSELLTHGVDLAFWRDPPERDAEALSALDALAGPCVVFWGVIDPRMDPQFVRETAARLPHANLVLIGPQQDPDPRLRGLSNVHFHPALPYELLPRVAARASALIMPYRDLPVTRAMQPLKLKEYLVTDRPVIVRRLPVTEAWADCCDLAATPAEFADQVARRLETGLPAEHRAARQHRLAAEGWDRKAESFSRILFPPHLENE